MPKGGPDSPCVAIALSIVKRNSENQVVCVTAGRKVTENKRERETEHAMIAPAGSCEISRL